MLEAFLNGRGYWHKPCVPVRDYWHTHQERRILKLIIKARKISNAKNSEGMGGWDTNKVLLQS